MASNLHRSNRYRIQTKLERAIQNKLEAHRAHYTFSLRNVPRPTMTYFACDDCHVTFGTTWLDHCPCCGSRSLASHDNLALATKEMN